MPPAFDSPPWKRRLIDETPIALPPTLARKLGVREAIMLQHLQYLASEGRGFEEDDGCWVHKTIGQWRQLLPSMGRATCFRILRKLVRGEFLAKRTFGDVEAYAIQHDALDRIAPPQMRAGHVSRLLFSERPLFFLPRLAALSLPARTRRRTIGEAGALVLQQLHFRLGRERHYRHGLPWVTRSFEEWEADLRFVELNHLRRIFYALRDAGLVLFDPSQTANHYSIDYARLARLRDTGAGENGTAGALVPVAPRGPGGGENGTLSVSISPPAPGAFETHPVPFATTNSLNFTTPQSQSARLHNKEEETIQEEHTRTAAAEHDPAPDADQTAADAAADNPINEVEEGIKLLLDAGVDYDGAVRLLTEIAPTLDDLRWNIARAEEQHRRGLIRVSKTGWLVMAIRRRDKPDAAPLFPPAPPPRADDRIERMLEARRPKP